MGISHLDHREPSSNDICVREKNSGAFRASESAKMLYKMILGQGRSNGFKDFSKVCSDNCVS